MLPTLRGIRGSIAPLKGLRVASRVAAPSAKTVTFMPVFGRTMFTMAKAPSNRVTTMCLRSVFPKRFFAEVWSPPCPPWFAISHFSTRLRRRLPRATSPWSSPSSEV